MAADKEREKIYKLLKIYRDQPQSPEGKTALKRARALMEKYGFEEAEFLQVTRSGYPPPGAPSLTGNPEFDRVVGRFLTSVVDLLQQQRKAQAPPRRRRRKYK